MSSRKFSLISDLLSRVRFKERSRESAWSRLLGRSGQGDLKGRGATQKFASSLWKSFSVIFKKAWSSKEKAHLLSSLVLSKTVWPMSLDDLWTFVAVFGLKCWLDSPPCFAFSFKEMWLAQGVRKEGLPFSSTFVLKLLTFGLCMLPRQTLPIRTQPRSSLWANGELWGPLICCLTFCTWWDLSPTEAGFGHSNLILE